MHFTFAELHFYSKKYVSSADTLGHFTAFEQLTVSNDNILKSAVYALWKIHIYLYTYISYNRDKSVLV